MKLVALVLILAAGCHCLSIYTPQKCTTETIYINKIVEEEKIETECVPGPIKEECRKLPVQQFGTGKCHVAYKEECHSVPDTREVPGETEKCTEIWVKKCDHKWEVDAKGDKIWVEDPTSCKDLADTECHKVKTTRTVTTTKTVCNNVKDRLCCDVQEPECTKVHKRVSVPKKVPKVIKKCEGGSEPAENWPDQPGSGEKKCVPGCGPGESPCCGGNNGEHRICVTCVPHQTEPSVVVTGKVPAHPQRSPYTAGEAPKRGGGCQNYNGHAVPCA